MPLPYDQKLKGSPTKTFLSLSKQKFNEFISQTKKQVSDYQQQLEEYKESPDTSAREYYSNSVKKE
jgi:hypothetical protein